MASDIQWTAVYQGLCTTHENYYHSILVKNNFSISVTTTQFTRPVFSCEGLAGETMYTLHNIIAISTCLAHARRVVCK